MKKTLEASKEKKDHAGYVASDIDEYEPNLFRKIMQLDGLSYEEMYRSLNARMNRSKVFKAGEGAGSSGSFFFFSKDNRFLVKTMTDFEKDIILANLDAFHHHFKSQPNSLIARIYGIFTV